MSVKIFTLKCNFKKSNDINSKYLKIQFENFKESVL